MNLNNTLTDLTNKVATQVQKNVSAQMPTLGGTLAPGNYDPFGTQPQQLDFSRENASYSGSDCVVFVQINNKLIQLGNLETISYSIHREKSPVRVLGRTYSKGYVSGQRTVAGSMVFIFFDKSSLYDVIKEIPYTTIPTERASSPLPDQLPPLDLILLFDNEYGDKSVIRLYGVEFMDEGGVFSINDLYSENTFQYVARDIDPMISCRDEGEFKDVLFARQVAGTYIDNQLSALLTYKSQLESQITVAQNQINTIDMENAKRVTAGIFTLGLSAAVYNLSPALTGQSVVSRDDLNREKDKQQKILDALSGELDKTNNQISTYESTLNGYNGTQPDNVTGGISRMNIK